MAVIDLGKNNNIQKHVKSVKTDTTAAAFIQLNKPNLD